MAANTRSNRSPITRRTFIATGAAVTAAATATALGGSRVLAAARPFAVGYVSGSESGAGLGTVAPWLGSAARTIVPAASIAADTSLLGAGSTVIQVHGLYPGKDASIRSAFLDVVYTPISGRSTVQAPFAAWTYGATSMSNRVSFVAPVSADGLPVFRLTLTTASGVTDVLSCQLTLKSTAGSPRLRKGFYLLGLRAGQWATQTALNPSTPNAAHLSLVVSVGV